MPPTLPLAMLVLLITPYAGGGPPDVYVHKQCRCREGIKMRKNASCLYHFDNKGFSFILSPCNTRIFLCLLSGESGWAGQHTGWFFSRGFSHARHLTRLSLRALGRLVQCSGVAQRDALAGQGPCHRPPGCLTAATHGGVALARAPSMLWASPERWSPAPHRPQAP